MWEEENQLGEGQRKESSSTPSSFKLGKGAIGRLCDGNVSFHYMKSEFAKLDTTNRQTAVSLLEGERQNKVN